MTKAELRRIIREEVEQMKMQEDLGVVSIGIPIAIALVGYLMHKKDKSAAIKDAEQKLGRALTAEERKEVSKALAAASAEGIEKGMGGGGSSKIDVTRF